jgi:clan AA aspartic protease
MKRGTAKMGMVFAEITLKNATDVAYAEDGHIKKQNVRETTVNALVDTGTGTLVISEEICQQLGLKIRGLRSATLANNTKEICKVTQPVEIHWKNRDTTCLALVASSSGDVLLGAIPLEDMDLIVNPVRQELAGAHGDEVVCMLK